MDSSSILRKFAQKLSGTCTSFYRKFLDHSRYLEYTELDTYWPMVSPLGHCRLDVINSVLASPSRYERSIFGTLPQSVQYKYLIHITNQLSITQKLKTLRPMAHDPSSPPKNWYQNLAPETWVQVLHTRRTRNWYQKHGVWRSTQKAGFSFQSYANDE